jgi:hypothetical protein
VRTAKRGLTFKTVSPKPFRGKAPAFPLPEAPVVVKTMAGSIIDQVSTEKFRARELQLWNEAWHTYPGAHVWAKEPWRHRAVAEWVRVSVRCESIEVLAALLAHQSKMAAEALATDGGLAAAGYVIADVETPTRKPPAKGKPRTGARSRPLRLVNNDPAAS